MSARYAQNTRKIPAKITQNMEERFNPDLTSRSNLERGAAKKQLARRIDELTDRITSRIDRMVEMVATCSPLELEKWLEEQRSLEVKLQNMQDDYHYLTAPKSKREEAQRIRQYNDDLRRKINY